jgi:hypothetical protein
MNFYVTDFVREYSLNESSARVVQEGMGKCAVTEPGRQREGALVSHYSSKGM